jgi:nitrate/nitrite transporter NarK
MGLGAVTMTGNIFGAFSASLIGYLIDTLGYQMALIIISGTVIAATALIYAVMQESPV